ncbi:hypothetical protein D3C80_1259040 [compost metagenome]
MRLVGSQHVATAGLQRSGALVGSIVSDRGVLQAVGAEVVGEVQLGGGTGLDAHGGAVEFLGTGHPELLVNQEALAVVIVGAGEVQAQTGVARTGPGGVARQHIDFAGLQRGEALLGSQRAVFDLGRIAKQGSSHCAAYIDVEAEIIALFIGVGEARQTIADTALNETFLLYCVQGRASVNEAADPQNGCGSQNSQGGFHHLH